MSLSKNVTKRGEPGVGVYVRESQECLYNSEGLALEGVRGVFHLELSRLKHCFLSRRGAGLIFVIQEFREVDRVLRKTGFFVTLDAQQLADLIWSSPDVIHTIRRSEIIAVSTFFCIFCQSKSRMMMMMTMSRNKILLP